MDKKPEKLVPEIRFKGFTDDWEQHKFDNVVKRINDKDDNPRLPHIEFENIISGNGTLNKNIKDLNSKKIGTKFQKEDILFGKLRPYLKNWYFAKENGIAVGDFWVLRAKKISVFVYYLIQTEKFYSIANLSSGSKMPRSDWNLVSNSRFNFPENTIESIKIGNLILQLDKLITLQQRKLEQLKQLKKAMLQQLFVDKNNKQPILKFKNFRNNWREYKLGEIVNLEDNKRKPVKATERMRGEIPYYGANGIQDYVKGYTHIGKHVLIAEDGANSVDDYPIYFISSPSWINNHTHVLTAKQEILSSEFLSYALKKINYAKYLVGSGRYKLNAEILKLIPLQIPTMNEQKNIEINLSKIDKLISLQQNKLTQLTTLKKYLLQKMFI